MKNFLLGMPLMALAVAVSGCSSSDIEVKSDLGESSLVKESAVTPYLFDKDYATSYTKKWIKRWKENQSECNQSKYLTKDWCDENYGSEVRKHEKDLNIIQKMPDIMLVKYRTIDTNVNGDKTASGYKYVSCIPQGEPDERVQWSKLIEYIDGINAKPKKDIEDNLLDDGLVTSSIQIKVCEKYGNT